MLKLEKNNTRVGKRKTL